MFGNKIKMYFKFNYDMQAVEYLKFVTRKTFREFNLERIQQTKLLI